MRFRPSRRIGALAGGTPPAGSTVPGSTGSTQIRAYTFAQKVARVGRQEFRPQTGIEENQGRPYPWAPDIQADVDSPLNPGIDQPGFQNPYRTIMYSVVGIGTSNPVQALSTNLSRTYLIIQNLGPGNLFVGIGVTPVAGGANVLNLVDTQVYEQVGGGFFLPPNPWFPLGLSICSSFVSPEYISLLADTAGTAAMILEGTWNSATSGAQPGMAVPGSPGSTAPAIETIGATGSTST